MITVTVAPARAGGQVVLVLRVVDEKGEELLGGGAVVDAAGVLGVGGEGAAGQWATPQQRPDALNGVSSMTRYAPEGGCRLG